MKKNPPLVNEIIDATKDEIINNLNFIIGELREKDKKREKEYREIKEKLDKITENETKKHREQYLNELTRVWDLRDIFNITSKYWDYSFLDGYELYKYFTNETIRNAFSSIRKGVKMPDGNILHDPEIAEEFINTALGRLNIGFDEYINKIEFPKNRNPQIDMVLNEIKTMKDQLGKLDKIENDIESMKTENKHDIALRDDGLINNNNEATESAPAIAYYLLDTYKMEAVKPETIMRYGFKKSTARQAITDAKNKIDKEKKQEKNK
jgi:hypothetical protein